MLTRRQFLKTSSLAAAALPAAGCIARPLPVASPYASAIPYEPADLVVNDIHSQLNSTRVDAIVKPRAVDGLRSALLESGPPAARSPSQGGRHAMGRQFGEAACSSTPGARPAPRFRRRSGDHHGRSRHAVAGAPRPSRADPGRVTGADRLSLGGALARNAHGRGLTLGSMIQQVEGFDLLGAGGEVRTCSRTEHPDLFRLAHWRRRSVRHRHGGPAQASPSCEGATGVRPSERPAASSTGSRKGFATAISMATTSSPPTPRETASSARGVFSCYEPVAEDTPLTANPTRFHPEDWARLTFYSHRYKRRASETYTSRYLATSGQIYWTIHGSRPPTWMTTTSPSTVRSGLVSKGPK